MLEESEVATRLPARDLNRARKFYSEKLGLDPIEERPGGLRYRSNNGFFILFESLARHRELTPRWAGRLLISRRSLQRSRRVA
jgi:catechol 2,3-dioxygenase-like lactoylglutathione lyase family enzyme